MEVLSREYGWTPNEIKALDYADVEAYFEIIRVRRKLEEAERKKHEDKIKRKR